MVSSNSFVHYPTHLGVRLDFLCEVVRHRLVKSLSFCKESEEQLFRREVRGARGGSPDGACNGPTFADPAELKLKVLVLGAIMRRVHTARGG